MPSDLNGTNEMPAPAQRCPECGAEPAPQQASPGCFTELQGAAGSVSATSSALSLVGSSYIGESLNLAGDVEVDGRGHASETRERAHDSADSLLLAAISSEQLSHAQATAARAALDCAAAATDRGRAAKDRQRALAYRATAALDRAEAARERSLAGIDELTGVSSRSLGVREIEREINRACRYGIPLALAYVHVDPEFIDASNNGLPVDTLLCQVAQRLRRDLDPHDVIVRVDEDDFVCALANVDGSAARMQLEQIAVSFEAADAVRPVSFGVSELTHGDDLENLIERASEDMRRIRGARLH